MRINILLMVLLGLFVVSCTAQEVAVCGDGVCGSTESQGCPQDCIRLPDFSVEQITFTPENPKVGSEVKFKSVIVNNGNEPASLVFNWDIEGLEEVTNQYAATVYLEPGESIDMFKTGKFSVPGMKRLTLIVDPLDSVKEISEGNNQAQQVIYVAD